MRRGTLFTLGPLALVAALALGVALAGYVTSPRPRIAAVRTDGPGPPATATQAAVTVAASPERTASASPSAPSGAPRSNDAAAMLRVHNELREAVGAPAARPDDRVTAAAQHHAEYLARSGAIGHDESPSAPGFTGVTVRDQQVGESIEGNRVSGVPIAPGRRVGGT